MLSHRQYWQSLTPGALQIRPVSGLAQNVMNRKADPGPGGMLMVFAAPMAVGLIGYLAVPRWVAWAGVELPVGLRIVGCGVLVAATGYYVWVQRALGTNFSMLLRIKEGHALVSEGPYAKVRHPMYAASQALGRGASLMSANAFVAVSWLGVFGAYLAWRMGAEEAMMLSRFGAEYQAYMERTGRLTPWF